MQMALSAKSVSPSSVVAANGPNRTLAEDRVAAMQLPQNEHRRQSESSGLSGTHSALEFGESKACHSASRTYTTIVLYSLFVHVLHCGKFFHKQLK